MDISTNDCFQLLAIVSGGKVPPVTMHSLRGSEPTALEADGCEWHYALLMVQARNHDDDDDCIGSTLGKLSCTCQEFVKFSLKP